MNPLSALRSDRKLVDVTGIEPVTPCLQSWGNLNLSRRFGCAYEVHNYLDCSKVAPNQQAVHLRFTALALLSRCVALTCRESSCLQAADEVGVPIGCQRFRSTRRARSQQISPGSASVRRLLELLRESCPLSYRKASQRLLRAPLFFADVVSVQHGFRKAFAIRPVPLRTPRSYRACTANLWPCLCSSAAHG